MTIKKKTNSTKKQSISSARPRSYSDLYKTDKSGPPQVYSTPAVKVNTTHEMTTTTVNWREEYAHVVRDLRTLLIVSAALFGIIIVTGFFI